MPAIKALSQYSDLELALMVLLGYFGNGQTRKNNLGMRYAAVQGIVEQILRGNVPAGSGSADPEKIKAAVLAVFQKTIDDVTEEIMNEL